MSDIDVAVIGAGCAGTYTGWRIKTAAPNLSVRLYEASDRVGGRLESLVPPGAPHLVAEFGGMGFTNKHVIVDAVVQTLGLKTAPFVSSGPAYAYLRGVALLGADSTDPAKIPYRLAPTEQNLDFASLMANVVAADLGIDVTTMTHEQWLAVFASHTVDGTAFSDIGFWNYLATLLTPEGFTYVRDTMGHDFPVENWNAADTLEWFFADFSPGTTYSTLVGGYETLPQAIGEVFVAVGGELALSTPLVRIESAPPDLRLYFGDGSQVDAGMVILALPRRALELVSEGSVVLDNDGVRLLLTAVSPVPVMKLFLAYDQPWWTAGGVADVWGHSVSTLPLRTTYYFGEEAKAPGGIPNDTNSLLMASYTDSLELSYWEGLRYGVPYPDQANPWTSQCPGSPGWAQQRASTAMVAEAQRQLALVHGVQPPVPYSAAFKDWRDDPYGGAMHTWNVGWQSDAVMAAVLQPFPTVPLYVCGEAYSRRQGWVEGAFDTAETLLESVLGYAPPPWLHGYTPGPGPGPTPPASSNPPH